MNFPRKDLFKLGSRYTVKVAVPMGPGDAFDLGERVTFVSQGYSYYDEAMIYEFKNARGASVEWWLSDKQPDALAAEIFEEIEGNPTL